MIVPTIHLNGTSADVLTDGLDEAVNTLRAAIEAVEACNPNARDYYPQGPHAITQAAAEHRSRVERLSAVRKELIALRELLQEQIDQR